MPSPSLAPDAPAPENRDRPPEIPWQKVLAGQPALVIGANSGIGRAVALGLAQAGADVAANYVTDPASAEAVAAEISTLGRKLIALKVDASKEHEVEAMFAGAAAAFGALQIVVSNAGLQRDSAYAAMVLQQWNTAIGVNLTGQFLVTRAAVREFLRRGPDPKVSAATASEPRP